MRQLPDVLVACLLGGGCYGYYPVDRPAPAEGRRVLLSLSDSGTFFLAPKIGPFGTGIEGLLESSSDTEYMMSVLVVKRYETAEDWRGERVAVPRRFVTALTERHFSPGRTALFSVAMAGALATIKGIFQGNNSSRGGGTSSVHPSG